MADRLSQRRSSPISNMTGITRYTRTHNIRAGVVRVGVQEADRGHHDHCTAGIGHRHPDPDRGMAVATLRAGDRVGTGRDVISIGSHACGHSAVVATCASPANT